jgi:DNA polymerase III epsilon subunit-like protein
MAPYADIFDRHVFVDLETTGLDPRVDEVIELGALFVHPGGRTREVSRLFRPKGPLAEVIRELTGITDEQLAGQPVFSEFIPELKELLKGWTVVAHNAAFEQSFLAKLVEGPFAQVLDSCELLHYLFPELDSHALDSLVRWANVGPQAAHRALKDCEDTYAVLCHAVERCIDEDRAEDLEDLLRCLDGSVEPNVPLINILRKIHLRCRPSPAHLSKDAGLGPLDLGLPHAERAPHAYLRAYSRRPRTEEPSRLSSWFQRRYPRLGDLAPAFGFVADAPDSADGPR